jgi:uncharacterized LabA/DUF88 family protein
VANIQEKRVDVQIAVDIIKNAAADKYDTAIIISGDSDYIPSIEYVKSAYPNKKIGVAIPLGRKAKELQKSADFSIKIKEIHLNTNQFSEIITLKSGEVLKRPNSWQ